MYKNQPLPTFVYTFPDKSNIKYAMPWTKGNTFKWRMDWLTSNFEKQILKKTKTQLPRLGFWNSGGDYGLVCGDIDDIPNGFESFDQLEDYLRWNIRKNFIVTRSASNKVKILGLVKFPAFKEMKKDYGYKSKLLKKISRLILETYLPDDIFKALDNNTSAYLYTYLTKRMYCDIKKIDRIELAAKIEATESHNSFNIHTINDKPVTLLDYKNFEEKKTDIHSYRMYKNSLPPFANRFINKHASKKATERECLMRILLASPSIAEDGFDLPCTELSRFLNTSHQNVNNWIKQLLKMDLLKPINETFSSGKYAKKYKASGELLDFFQKEAAVKKSKKLKTALPARPITYTLPEAIPDGCWNTEIWYAINYQFKENKEAFLAWLDKLSGLHDKLDRRPRALKQYDRYIIKKGRKQSS